MRKSLLLLFLLLTFNGSLFSQNEEVIKINGVGIMPVNSGPAIGNGEYYVFNVAMYGQTTRDGEVRGTVFEYTY